MGMNGSLMKRIITGFFIALLVCVTLFLSHISTVLDIVIVALCVQAIYELYRTGALKDSKKAYGITCMATVIITVITVPQNDFIVMLLFLIAIIGTIYSMTKIDEISEIDDYAYYIMAIMIIFFYNTMSYIRELDKGFYILTIAVLTPIITDIFAYFIGKTYGKHKLAPIISPNKTIEGAIGGTIFSVVITMLLSSVAVKLGLIHIEFSKFLFYAPQASIIGQLGDLALSTIKRIVGIKDYGTLFPGHGGVLDRFDSLLFVLPYTYLFCLCLGSFYY